MEFMMHSINHIVPKDYAMLPTISKIPRALLGHRVSRVTVETRLAGFKTFCQTRLNAINIKLNITSTPDLNLEEELGRGQLLEGREQFIELMSTTDELQRTFFFKPTPSGYADQSIWAEFQDLPGAILCLRPTDRHGLPLTLLHPIFSRFRHLSRQPLPNSPQAVKAMRAALRLCSIMGNTFRDENDHSQAFDKAMEGFLPGLDGTRHLEGNEVNSQADRVYRVGGVVIIIREDKLEMGKAGDAYTQVARSFDLACENMDVNGVTPDTPVFLLCVMGPTLTIAGGFKDGEHTVVEPLSSILFMLKDFDNGNGRAVQLAAHLFALSSCLEQLPLLPAPSPVPGMPRIFPERGLTFQQRLEDDKLIFRAVDNTSRQLCVKFIYRQYGEEVHRMLSQNNMAPELLDVSHIDGGPTMIVMEMLDDSWQTLHDFAQRRPEWNEPSVKLTIRKRLDDIVTKLESGEFVHGDFRTNNIMVKPGEEGSAMVIDFDWAGKGGEVYYPLERNHAGIPWPAEVASAIHLGHDRSMLGTQWASLQRR